MSETSPSPLEIYNVALPQLTPAFDAYHQAIAESQASGGSEAHVSALLADAEVSKVVRPVRRAIFASIVAGAAPPMESLHAVALIDGYGGPEAVCFVEATSTLQEQMQADTQLPIAVIGAKGTILVFGTPGGGIDARHEITDHNYHNLRLRLPLLGLHRYGVAAAKQRDAPSESLETMPLHRLDPTEKYLVDSPMQLSKLRVIGDAAGIEEAIDTVRYADLDHVSALEYRTAKITGMLPLIAYGKVAVREALKQIARNSAQYPAEAPRLQLDQILATGVNMGIDLYQLMTRPDLDPQALLNNRLMMDLGSLAAGQVSATFALLSPSARAPISYLSVATSQRVIERLGLGADKLRVVRDAVAPLFREAGAKTSSQNVMREARRVAESLGPLLRMNELRGEDIASVITDPAYESSGPYF